MTIVSVMFFFDFYLIKCPLLFPSYSLTPSLYNIIHNAIPTVAGHSRATREDGGTFGSGAPVVSRCCRTSRGEPGGVFD